MSNVRPSLLYNPPVSFVDIDAPSVARALSLISQDSEDLVDAFFERREELELAPEGEMAPRLWREEGLAIRLEQGSRSWLAVRDEISPEAFLVALRRTARRLSQGVVQAPRIAVVAWGEVALDDELLSFERRVRGRLRSRRLVFPMRMWLRRHRRWRTGSRCRPGFPAGSG